MKARTIKTRLSSYAHGLEFFHHRISFQSIIYFKYNNKIYIFSEGVPNSNGEYLKSSLSLEEFDNDINCGELIKTTRNFPIFLDKLKD